MKRRIITIALSTAILLLIGSPVAFAQQQQQQQQAQQVQQMMGQQVMTQTGEELGSIENFVQDNSGNVQYVILSRSGGQVTIPWQKINRQDQKNITADVDLSNLQQFAQQGGKQQQNGQQTAALDQILGKEVQGSGGESLGEINNIVIGAQGGTLVVIEGDNQENYPIPLQALQQQQDNFSISQDQQNFQTAPSYAQQTFPNLDRWQNVIHGYYGVDQQQTQQQRSQQQPGQQQQSGQQDQADISVRQPAPRVRVDQTQPRVQVSQPEPEVMVQQKQPDVQVTQPQPQVRVTQPQPEVRVNIPEPQVEVNQPRPQVQVKQPRPDVQVKQPQPQVQVRQPKPDVNVEQGRPQVEVERSQPQVSVQEQGQPQVTVQRQGEPEVSVQQQGEAEVQVRQGKPQVSVVQKDRQQQQAMTADQADASQSRNWIDQKVMTQDGEEIGTVNDVQENNGRISYVLIEGQDGQIHPVPAYMVLIDPQGQGFQANFDKKTFEESPGFSAEQQQQMAQGEWQQEVRGYYQQQNQDQTEPESKQ